MRLALRMGRTLRELLASIDSRELTLWAAFDRLEPFGGDAEDYRAALAASVTYNMNRGQGRPARHPLDFIPWSEHSKQQIIVLKDGEEGAAFDRTIGLQ